jgi:hypothetical protein
MIQEVCTQCHKVEVGADVKQMRAIEAVAAVGWDPAALGTELNDKGTGPILKETETGQHPEWKDITDHSRTYKSYWARWKSLAVRNHILEHHWESANRWSPTHMNFCMHSVVTQQISYVFIPTCAALKGMCCLMTSPLSTIIGGHQ